MTKGLARGRACLAIAFLLFVAAPVWAQSHVPEDEYKDQIRVSQDIQPLGDSPFGENINLYDGSLSFAQTDVSLAGNGPLLQFTRSYILQGHDAYDARAEYAFGDWILNLPRIETLTATGYSSGRRVSGWEVNTAGDPNNRCSAFAQPPALVAQQGDAGLTPWDPDLWWKGYHLIIPGQGSHDLLANIDAQTKSAYPAVTQNHWRVSCIPAQTHTANGEPGEGFIAHAPDGTRYTFNELVYRYAPSLTRPVFDGGLGDVEGTAATRFVAASKQHLGELIGLLTGSAPAHALPAQDFLNRRTAWMLVTQIQDRFGNTLNFSYNGSGHLTKITASDGRAVHVSYVSGAPNVIHSVTLQPASGTARTWTYNYSGTGSTRTLTAVAQPDASQWQYALAAFDSASLEPSGPRRCATVGEPAAMAPTSGTITHPSGLTATFTVKPVKHGRSDVPRDCKKMQYGHPTDPGSYATIPDAWYGFAITQKTFSGAGLSTET